MKRATLFQSNVTEILNIPREIARAKKYAGVVTSPLKVEKNSLRRRRTYERVIMRVRGCLETLVQS